ncbi:MBL fold metallo-hydrolase [Ramlibacter sp. AW1]|uniref:MBL fold metallo-hydrolase n=1 Tax=Ramlibacter aurantiacus TaxID=2801330 RepID=A0A936ZDM4_9BURK|nr:MBL fold metallo-hydrolase [Ramlibacter aurantiacus]MBL0419007.1 MBL fold metallo-hydrolase [Ramlibacter aurantiacus]
MDLTFLGATGTVTGSKYLVASGGRHLLVDCGLFQGYKQLRLRNWEPLPAAAARLDAIVLTHAHIDHSGYLPRLWKQGFRGPVYCTAPTRDLCRIMLPDSGGLQEEEAEYANRHRFSKHTPALPLYTREDAEHSLRLFETVPWHQDWEPVRGLHARLGRAGHMPGAAHLRLADGHTSVLFSGDLGRPDDRVLRAPEPPPAADYVVTESTYGDRLHLEVDVLEQLAQVINRTSARGGTVVIPAFAVGRAQTLLHCIDLLKKQGRIHHLPVYLNSPMAADALGVFSRHSQELRLSSTECRAMEEAAHIVRTVDESRELNARRGPMVIIAGSGMATGGRVVHHLKAFGPDRRNTILLVGFQAGGTRGAKLRDGADSVRIHGEDIPIRAEVAVLDALSGHADASQLEAWLRQMAHAPRRAFVTHGEPDAADALRQRLERRLGWAVTVPEQGQRVVLA